MEDQNQFLNGLRKIINKKKYVNSCLWSFSYSHMTLKISFLNENDNNEKEILEIVKKTMTTPVFVRLMNQNFKNNITTKYVNGELWITWERERDREHPHGKVNIFMCAGSISYGTDEAGSVWWSPSVGVWKLHKYKE